jgi:hypothetical protein
METWRVHPVKRHRWGKKTEQNTNEGMAMMEGSSEKQNKGTEAIKEQVARRLGAVCRDWKA